MIILNGLEVKPTKFPDGTSQVWNVQGLSDITNHILWKFEHEAEVFQVIQLIGLCHKLHPDSAVLEMPFLPYARQDKSVSNDQTFAGRIFISLFENLPVRVVVKDAHNADVLPEKWTNQSVDVEINKLADKLNVDLIFFPDTGAMKRYKTTKPYLVGNKVRHMKTGEIIDYSIVNGTPAAIEDARVLIVDDICDGGRTFIEAANELYKRKVNEVLLYTTHGIYSKGLGVLKEAGIKRIFNYQGEV